MKLAPKHRKAQASDCDTRETLVHLLLAAQADPTFRKRVLCILNVPALQRESLIHSAIHEMRLRGEPETTCAAFATLATEAGTKIALQILDQR